MPITFSIDQAEKIIHTEAVGPVTYDELVDHISMERDAGGIPYREIFDATRATAAFSARDARRLVDIFSDLAAESGGFGPTAVIVADDVTYGMVRMIQILATDICDISPFRVPERAAAEAWVRSAPLRPKVS
jgi:hypothetical protein